MFQFVKEILIEDLNSNPCYDFTYDGSFYYVATNTAHIYKINADGTLEETIHTRRRYHSIVYDAQQDCFWAASQYNRDIVYQLSSNFRETSYLQIRFQNLPRFPIGSLSYCQSGYIFLALTNLSLCRLEQNGYCSISPLEIDTEGSVHDVYAIQHLKIWTSEKENQISLFAANTASNQILASIILPSDIQFKSLLAYSDPDIEGISTIKILGTRESQSLILEYSLPVRSEEISAPSQAPDMDILADIPLSAELQSQRLNPNFCNQRPHPSGGCQDNSCCCDKCCPDKCRERKCCHCTCIEILETIACQEASLAHILNAEGEKIQMAVKNSKNIQDLLKVNESVQNTIIHASHLEIVLYSKLQCALSACKDDKNCTCCCKDSHS